MPLIQGRAWVFGDNINTDLITPGRYLYVPVQEAAKHTFEAVDPEFSKNVRPGDILVAGKNFGCGSARDTAPQVFQCLGIACILAEDFARIFFRNAISFGLPALTVKGISGRVQPLDELAVCLDSWKIQIKKTGETLAATPLPPKMKAVIEAGGIDGLLKSLKKDGHV